MSELSESPNEANDGDSHMLESNQVATRLNIQFFLWKDTFGYNIHPSIPLTQENACIAEIATGTGIWLINVAREQPKAELHGFDSTLEQVPRQFLPDNVTLRQWDVFDEIPEDTVGKFDMVHLRLLGLVVPDGNLEPILKNICKMLKPGGHLQWDESDHANTIIQATDPLVGAPAWTELLGKFQNLMKYDRVDQAAKAVGFEDARLYRFEDRKDMMRMHMESALLFFKEFASRLEASSNRNEARNTESNLRGAQTSGEDCCCCGT